MDTTALGTNQIMAIIGLYLDVIGVLLAARTFFTILLEKLNHSQSELVFTIIVGGLALATAATLKFVLPNSILSIIFIVIFASGLIGFISLLQCYRYLPEILAIILIVTGFLLQILSITM
jgi:hypothetical protein